MNTSKRFLVLNSKNEAQRPCDHGYHGPDLQGDKSPSFLKEESAKAFGDFLAQCFVGQNFYLAEVKSAVVQYTEPVQAGDWQPTVTPEG